MNFLVGGSLPSSLQAAINAKAQEQEDVINIMMVFPMSTYNVHPSYEQFLSFVEEMQVRYPFTDLYTLFSSGLMTPEVDTIICKHAANWPPLGKTVDSELPIKRLE